MAVQGRTEAVKTKGQKTDTPRKDRKDAADKVPASWKLTPQQQAFIDAFAEDEPKKQ
ncbi:hypothetical protein [Silvania hatchlandensis]|uniref:Uncharacterized protein n=1 Tax=Silvania hatchlandensis TaxID=2926469 RepID=A0A9J6Q7J5_9ENTR|nr:hypothetical protein [Silvania hatchlandensis]MCU6666684.1 hypothetical protein [Silvania hatchlandensis]